MQLLEYRLDRIVNGKDPFPETIDYSMTVPCTNRDDTLIYIFRSYRFRSYLYITDFFPKIYENDPDRFHRFTSHEGFSVSIRRISVTCLAIFVDHFIKKDVRNAMVVSGSYQDNEPHIGPSRKLKLYQYFYYPLLDQLQLRSVEIMEQNAFILTSRNNPIQDEEIRHCYLDFKSMI